MIDKDIIKFDSSVSDVHHVPEIDAIISFWSEVKVVYNFSDPSTRRVVTVPNLDRVQFVTTLGTTLCAVDESCKIYMYDISSPEVGPVYDTEMSLGGSLSQAARLDASRIVLGTSGGHVRLVRRHSRMKLKVEWEISLGRKTDIRSIAAHADRVSVCSESKMIICAVQTGEIAATIDITEVIGDSSLSSPGLLLMRNNILAVVSSSYLYRLGSEDFEHERTIKFKHDPNTVQIAPSGNSILCAFAGRQGSLELYDIDNGVNLWTHDVPRDVRTAHVLPDGKILCAASQRVLVIDPPENIKARLTSGTEETLHSRAEAEQVSSNVAGEGTEESEESDEDASHADQDTTDMKRYQKLFGNKAAVKTMDRETLAAVWAAFSLAFDPERAADFSGLRDVFLKLLKHTDLEASDISSLGKTGVIGEVAELATGAVYRAGEPSLSLGLKHRITSFLYIFGRE